MIDFTENGVRFKAFRGMACASRGGNRIWSAMDVFRNKEPTREDVLKLNEFFEKTFDKAWNEAKAENGFKRL